MWVKCTTSAEDQNSKYLAASPVMDNTEQLRPEAMEDLDTLISKRKLDGDNKGFEALGVFQEVQKDLTKDQNYFENIG